MSAAPAAGVPLRCVFLGYLWKVARELHESPAARLLAVGLEPQRTRTAAAGAWCESAGVERFDARRLRRNDDWTRITAPGIDLLVVGAFGQILRTPILAAPTVGTLNVHPSALPAYRGGWPIEWQILSGERRGGVTIHWMTEEVDRGDVAAQRSFAIGGDDDYEAVFERAHSGAAELMSALLEQPPERWPRRPQPAGGPPVAARSARDGLIDWHLPGTAIRRLVLAEGWRGWVRSELAEGDLVVRRVEPASRPPGARPGEVVAGGARPAVATGDGALRLVSFDTPLPLRAGTRLPSKPRREA